MRQQKIDTIACLLFIILLSGCIPGFRSRPVAIVIHRQVVLRERRFLNRRIRTLRRALHSKPDLKEAEVRDRAFFRLRRMKHVLRMLLRKLYRQRKRIYFRRDQWRMAYNAGCRRYR